MSDEYIYVTGSDGEIYEVLPTEALLSFLRRLAEDESEEHNSDLAELDVARLTIR